MRIAALLYALSWVAVRGMLVCGCPASKGGILRAISPAGRRFRASALVSGRKNHDVYTFLCIHVHLFLVFAFRDARFLSGLYHRFSYIVQAPPGPHFRAVCPGGNSVASWETRQRQPRGTPPDTDGESMIPESHRSSGSALDGLRDASDLIGVDLDAICATLDMMNG